MTEFLHEDARHVVECPTPQEKVWFTMMRPIVFAVCLALGSVNANAQSLMPTDPGATTPAIPPDGVAFDPTQGTLPSYQPTPPLGWDGPIDPSDPTTFDWGFVSFGAGGGGSATSGVNGSTFTGPMGTVSIALNNLPFKPPTSDSPDLTSLLLGTYMTLSTVTVDLVTNPGYNWNTVTGFICVTARDLKSGEMRQILMQPVQSFSFGSNTYSWTSGPLIVPRGYCLCATFTSVGLGYMNGAWWNESVVWCSPPISTTLFTN